MAKERKVKQGSDKTPRKSNANTPAAASEQNEKKKGGKVEILQKALSGPATVVETMGSRKDAQAHIEHLVAQSNGSLKLHDFEINEQK